MNREGIGESSKHIVRTSGGAFNLIPHAMLINMPGGRILACFIDLAQREWMQELIEDLREAKE